MNKVISKYLDKLYFKKWIIGYVDSDIQEIIRTRTFKPDIQWFHPESMDTFYADPFPLKMDEKITLLLEEFSFKLNSGKLAFLEFQGTFKDVKNKIILDTKSHLSYPFIYEENNTTYVFPESGDAGKLSCYRYDHADQSLTFVKDIIKLPLQDSTVLKHGGKYWLFGILPLAGTYELNVYFSDVLLGPYAAHPQNPVKTGLNGTRPAGNFIAVDADIYRPTQNCENVYGESITIQKITELTETRVAETVYMDISIHKKKRHYSGLHTIHTINAINNIILVDGEHWTFSPFHQLRKFIADTFN